MDNERLMLDTTAISAFFGGRDEIKRHIDRADELFINPVILAELLDGLGTGERESGNSDVLQGLLSSPRVRIAAIDGETSHRYAAILAYLREKGVPVPYNDLWIAASAMQYGLKVLTTDRHFLDLPQIITTCCEPAA